MTKVTETQMLHSSTLLAHEVECHDKIVVLGEALHVIGVRKDATFVTISTSTGGTLTFLRNDVLRVL